MKVAIAQLNPKVGDIGYNSQLITQSIQTAISQRAELIVFPELATIGYPPRDLLFDPLIIHRQTDALHSFATLSSEIAILLGCVRSESTKLFNSVAIFERKKTRFYDKQLLPNYDVFDEERYFAHGENGVVLMVGGKRVGLSICEDIWNFEGFRERSYTHQPIDWYRNEKLDYLVNLSSSPFHLGRDSQRTNLLHTAARFAGCPVIYVNQVGANEEVIFDGCSQIVDTSGAVLGRSPAFQECVQCFDLNSPMRVISPWPSSKEEWLYRALVVGIRDFFKKNGQKNGMTRAIIGLSGGIDSSVVACLAVKALGSDNTLGVLMPSPHTSPFSTEDALNLARILNIDTLQIPIQTAVADLEKAIGQSHNEPLSSVTLENLQPRVRMTILMAVANQRGGLVLNTSNKSEIATGYSTQYGDTAGALSVIGDLVKADVYSLAEFLNRETPLIPRRVFERPPTAELQPNQTDQDRLPPYDILDPMVRATIEEGKNFEDLREFDPKLVSQYRDLYRASEFKRRQFPPILRVSRRAFGIGRRIPLSAQIA